MIGRWRATQDVQKCTNTFQHLYVQRDIKDATIDMPTPDDDTRARNVQHLDDHLRLTDATPTPTPNGSTRMHVPTAPARLPARAHAIARSSFIARMAIDSNVNTTCTHFMSKMYGAIQLDAHHDNTDHVTTMHSSKSAVAYEYNAHATTRYIGHGRLQRPMYEQLAWLKRLPKLVKPTEWQTEHHPSPFIHLAFGHRPSTAPAQHDHRRSRVRQPPSYRRRKPPTITAAVCLYSVCTMST